MELTIDCIVDQGNILKMLIRTRDTIRSGKSFMSIENLLSLHNSGRDIIFDLDDTLYAETDFLFAVYEQIAERFYGNRGGEVLSFLTEEFARAGRKAIFDKLLLRHPEPGLSIERLLAEQRSFQRPGFLRPYPWFTRFCSSLPRPLKIRIVTNGTPEQQRNKILSLDLRGLDLDLDVAYASTLEPKPSPRSLELLGGYASLRRPVYVGDSEVDLEFSRNSGMEFFDVALLKQPSIAKSP
jgi:putative hydrolase of the HAD superfamily